MIGILGSILLCINISCGSVTHHWRFTRQTSSTMNCTRVDGPRSSVHCGVVAVQNAVYHFAFTFRDGECWICRAEGTPAGRNLLEQAIDGATYVTGNVEHNGNYDACVCSFQHFRHIKTSKLKQRCTDELRLWYTFATLTLRFRKASEHLLLWWGFMNVIT